MQTWVGPGVLRLDAALHSIAVATLIVEKTTIEQPTVVTTLSELCWPSFQMNGGLRQAGALQGRGDVAHTRPRSGLTSDADAGSTTCFDRFDYPQDH